MSLEILKRHEGFRATCYKCTAGKLTIGYGYNLEANPLKLRASEVEDMIENGITRHFAEILLTMMVCEITKTLQVKIEGFEKLDEARRWVLINMCYNMGLNGLLGFKNTLEFIRKGNYESAAYNMMKSKWAAQVKGRASELAKIMRDGI
ncbi:MAG: glycoside hydrolase family protein [Methylococcaceae bacterium]